MTSYVGPAHGEPFPCFTPVVDEQRVVLCADWDGNHSHTTGARRRTLATKFRRRINRDLYKVRQLLPEAGPPVVYTTGHGAHAVWSYPVRADDALALLQLLSLRASDWYHRLVIGQGLGTICPGFTYFWMDGPPRLRVGRKEGRPRADIFRVTPRSQGESPWVMLHDSLVKHFNHKGRPYLGVPQSTSTLSPEVNMQHNEFDVLEVPTEEPEVERINQLLELAAELDQYQGGEPTLVEIAAIIDELDEVAA